MLRSPSDLGSEDQRRVELAGCSMPRGFFTQFLEEDFYEKSCDIEPCNLTKITVYNKKDECVSGIV